MADDKDLKNHRLDICRNNAKYHNRTEGTTLGVYKAAVDQHAGFNNDAFLWMQKEANKFSQEGNKLEWILYGINGLDLSIGIVQDGAPVATVVERENIDLYNVTYMRHVVDFGETFQVFRAVNRLDSNQGVDIIIILTNVKPGRSTLDYNVLVSENKPLIYWGRTPLYPLQVPSSAPVSTRDRQCPASDDERPHRSQGKDSQDYCFHNLARLTGLGNGTILEHVTLTGANILSTLVTKSLNWTSVFIFHENNTETEAHALVKQLSARGVLTVTHNVDVVQNLFDIMLNIYNKVTSASSYINGIVLCRFACIRRLFLEANNFDEDARGGKTLLKQMSRWLIASYGHVQEVSDTLVSCAHDLDNVAVVAFPGPNNYNLSQDFSGKVRLILCEFENLVQSKEDTDYNGSLLEYVTDRLQTLSGVSKCEALKIETLMWTSGGRGFSNVGYVSTDGVVVIFSYPFPNTKYGYNKRKFLVSTLHYPPFVNKSMINGTAKYEGWCMDLLKEMARNLNFTYNLTEPPDLKWGSPGPNGTFNGMIGQLQREEVDIVAADLSIQKEREMVMDFAFPYYFGDTSVLLKKPDPNARKWRTLVDPLKWQVLMAVGILLPGVSLLALLFEKFNPYNNDKNEANVQSSSETYRLSSFKDAFWYMYGALLCQGGVNLPESQAGRTFVSCWWFFCIVLVATYCGNLIAFLTITKDKPPFNTLDEMANLKNEYKWGTLAGTNWEHVFKTSTRSEFRKIGDSMMEFNKTDPSVMASDIDIQLAKVKKGGYGWIGDTVVIEIQIAKDCDLMMIKERFLPLKYAFGFTNNSPHKNIFSNQMLSIHASGLLNVWKRRWWPKANICAGSIVTEAKPILIVDVQSAFYVAAGGGLLGFLAFLVEVLIGYIRRHKCPSRQSQTSDVVSNTQQ